MSDLIAIFGKDMKESRNKLEEIIGEMKFKDVEWLKLQDGSANLKNGNEYRCLPANEGSKGYRYNKIYMSRLVNIDLAYTLINNVLFINHGSIYNETNNIEWY